MKNIKNIKTSIVLLFLSLWAIASLAQTTEVKPPIFEAVEKADVELLKSLIKSGANVNSKYQGISLLNYACGGNWLDNNVVEVLLNAPGINVKTITLLEEGIEKTWATTPLVALISNVNRNPKVSKVNNVIKLIKMGVDINYHSSFNNNGTALWLSTFGSQNDESRAITMAILNNASTKLDVNYVGIYKLTALRNAVNGEHLEAVEAILKRGGKVEDIKQNDVHIGLIPETMGHANHDILDVLMKYGANKYGPNAESSLPLNFAMANAKYAEWADYFITKYAVDVNHLGKAKFSGDMPAICDAARFNNVEGLKVLIKHGANINLATSQGLNAIQVAASSNSLDFAKYLIKEKVVLNGYNSLYMNALCYAAVMYNDDMLELLVKSGADVNAVSKDSPWAGPLARIAMTFNPLDKKKIQNTLKKLLELGADPNVLHAQDMTAMMCAAKLGTNPGWKAAVDHCELLIEKGANVNLKSTTGETALMLAAASGNEKLVNLLIKKGADVDAENKVKETVLTYANRAIANKTEIVKALQDAGAKNLGVASASQPIPAKLIGTWQGYQTDDKLTMATFVVNKNNTYSYTAKGKYESYSHKGTIVASEDTYTLTPTGKASATYSYKIVDGKLSANNGRPLNKIK